MIQKKTIQFIVISAALLSVTLAVNIQVPLYTYYAGLEGRDLGSTAVMFSMYVAGLMPTLVFLGDVSNRIGRKATLMAALASALTATLIVYYSPTIETLMLARLLQGIGVGLGVGTVAAYLKDISITSKSASLAITLSTSIGFGGGALLTSTTLALWPESEVLSYRLYLMVAGAIILVAAMYAPVIKAKGGSALRLPVFVGGDLLPHLSIALAWMVSGLLIAIVPSQLQIHGQERWVGPALFLVNMVGVLAQPLAGRIGSHRSMLIGHILIPTGLALLLYGSHSGNVLILLIGSALAGSACYGFTYLGGMSRVVQDAQDNQARAVSGFMVFAYIGFALPSLLLGQLSSYIGISKTLVVALVFVISGSLFMALQQYRREYAVMAR